MQFSAQRVLSSLRQNGLKLTLVSVASALALGVADQFGGKIVPSIAGYAQNLFDPPRFAIVLDPPVEVAADLRVSHYDAGTADLLRVTQSASAPNVYIALGPPGTYILRLRGGGDRAGQELIDTQRIAERSGAVWRVDTENERSWARADQLVWGVSGTPSSNTTPTSTSRSRLRDTRWIVTDHDLAAIGAAPQGVMRSALANALAEVGVFEKGSEEEKLRILAYWGAVRPEFPGVSAENLTVPWGGAFLAWVVRQSGALPPGGAQSFLNWRNWADSVPRNQLEPGMVAVFRLDEAAGLPQASSRRLIGIVVQRRPDCIEIIAGNIADRVVLTCVVTNLLESIRRPRLASVGN